MKIFYFYLGMRNTRDDHKFKGTPLPKQKNFFFRFFNFHFERYIRICSIHARARRVDPVGSGFGSRSIISILSGPGPEIFLLPGPGPGPKISDMMNFS
jgi:hypothetical protein